uniref:YcfA-like protein n=1 Tax=Kuenenia stuttgartiensis TaxID=174633 RepID=Q1PVK0_KUEST|nr:hypothetical protein kustc0512 [Candidatus Kuenenia stuttgartiensis]
MLYEKYFRQARVQNYRVVETGFKPVYSRKGSKTIRGSHHVYMKIGKKERISVPVHGNKDLKAGLLRAIMKIAEIAENEL